MPTFIDESGDTGHARHSKPYFRIAAVWLPDQNAASDFRVAARQLRQSLSLQTSYEFKFVRTCSFGQGCQGFFEAALASPFRFAACAIDKRGGYWGRAGGQEQHWAVATSLAACLRQRYLLTEKAESPLREQILVDDNGDNGFLDKISVAFRGLKSVYHPNAPLTQPAKFRKSHSDEVMQLVDMVCGATGAYLDGQDNWYNLIKDRCLGLIRIP